jgi:hypothetical protein
MSLKNQWLVNITMIILSWLSLAFYGRRSIKIFLHASIMVILLEIWNARIGKQRKWWIFYNKPNSFITGELPFNIGPFFAAAMWTLKWANRSFKKFLLINAVIDGFFALVISTLMEKLKIVKFVRLNKFQFLLYIFYKPFFLYGFQYLFEKNKSKCLSKSG